MKKQKIINLKKFQRGLPGKSYIYLLELDRELYFFLSCMSKTPFFDYYISSLIKRYYRVNDRERALENFLKFSVTYSEDRITYIYPSKILDRISCIKFLNMIYQSIDKYTKLKQKLKKNKVLTKDEYIFYNIFSKRWVTDEFYLFKQIKSSYRNVTRLVNQLYDAHLHFIVKYLLKNRRGHNAVQDCLTIAYEVVLEVINIYDPKRSKVPFFKLAQTYAYNFKNRTIKEETWGLNSKLIHLDALTGTKVLFENSSKTEIKLSDEIYDESQVKKDFEKELDNSYKEEEKNEEYNESHIKKDFELDKDLEVGKVNKKVDKKTKNKDTEKEYVQTLTIKNNIWKNIESSLYYEKKQNDKLKLIDMAYQALPRPIKEITSILYELVYPLSVEQELEIAFLTKEEE